MKDDRIFWFLPRFKDAMEFHWCDFGKVLNDDEKLELRFRMFCRKNDCNCFVEDLKNELLIEFNGAKAQGIRICKEIIEKEMRTKDKQKHKQ